MQKRILSILTEGLPGARRVLEIVVALAAGLVVARLIWLLVEPGGAVSKPIAFASSTSSGASATASSQLDLMILARANHFGVAASSAPILPSAPETSLNLRLKGVRAIPLSAQSDQTDNSSIAIIQTPDQAALTYRRGDTIIEGVTLEEILPDRVLIMKGGTLETLMMESSASGLSVLLMPGQEPRAATQPRLAAPISTAGGQSGNLLAFMDFEPVLAEGSVTGYRIQGRGNDSYLASMGLQSGDIVVEVAGNRVANTDRQNLLAQLSSATQIDLTVERGGALQSISVSIPRGD